MGVAANRASSTAVQDRRSDPNRNAPPGWWFIYFFGTEDGEEVKLGKTKQRPTTRRLQHENHAGHDVPMRTLAVVLGQAADEKALKRHFAPWRSRKRSDEWIRAGEEMRGYLRWLRSCSFVAPGELELSALTPVDSALWLPGADRTKAPLQLRLTEEDPWSDLHLDHVAEGDYYTHPTFIEAAREAMGSIDLDPASCREANSVVQATRFLTFRENGLLHEWEGNVWLNPPYGNWGEWAPKTVAEWSSGRISQMCVLCTSRVTTAQSFHPIVRAADAVFIPSGRYEFWGPKATGTPDEGHFIFYFGSDVARFVTAFRLIGTVFARRDL